ncbi:UDP-N-acetylmuramoyl-L-alanine--D-glutamate ligase [Candidatus Saccharibacteria bacterium]|nr:UDP-N-acetylmuramoyl-L-alanine--D-glutamate ligase [Candidatus Saccharibacteria bacterium]
MKIAILGYGKEGKAAERYFAQHNAEIKVIDNFTEAELDTINLDGYDLILRSPSVRPRDGFSSMTKYFFDHAKAPIIGVTGTKGKGTTCSLIETILTALGKKVYLVGNIGNPSIDVLDELTPDDVVVYEMSSFQLWDLKKSPQVAVILRIEADHLNVHYDFDDYVNAKGHIAEYQNPEDSIVYFSENEWSVRIANKSKAEHRAEYPLKKKPAGLDEILNSLGVPGEHNKENAEAALLAVAEFLGVSLEELIKKNSDIIREALAKFKGLPHHIEFVRNIHGVDYYDDSFSASYPSLEVAIKTFNARPVILIAGGKDRGLDLAPMKRAIFDADNLQKVILMGETSADLAKNEDAEKFILVNSLEEAVENARKEAEKVNPELKPVVLLSPGAASFDMFKDFYDRGDQFKALVQELK